MEQYDLVECEARCLLIDYVANMVQVFAAAGVTNESRELIKRLESVYFVGLDEVEKKKSELVAKELRELATKTFTLRPGHRGEPFKLEIGNKNE